MTSLKLSTIQLLEKMHNSKTDLIKIAKNIKIFENNFNVNETQKEINKNLEIMAKKNQCEEISYFILKKFYYIVNIFEQNIFLSFANTNNIAIKFYKNDIIQEFKNFLNNLSKDEANFFCLYYFNKNLRDSMVNYSDNKGDIFFFTFEIISEIFLG